jgi:alpha-D-xyloside xylohydrolase
MSALRWRYRLMPYLRQAAAQAGATGLPVQRAMALAFPNDRLAWGFDTQFMCGDDILVAPCVRADHRLEVYLPPGPWCRFPTGERFDGGRVHAITLPLDAFAAFVPQGRSIPLADPVASTAAWGGEPLVPQPWRAD